MKKFILSIILAVMLIASPASAEFFPDIIVTSPHGIWTDSRAYTTLNAAITAVGANERTIKIVSPQTVTSLTVPSNVTLSFERNGSITNSGQLIINSRNIIAKDRQIFTGTGDIDFAVGSVVRSAWFSDVAEAINVTTDDELTLIISKASFVTSSCTVGNNVNLKWESARNQLTANGGVVISNIKNIEAGNFQIFAGAGDFDFLDGSELKLNWFARLSSVLTWVESEEVTIIVNEDSAVQVSVATTANENLKILPGGKFSFPAGVTLTTVGSVKAASNAFDLNATANLTINGSFDAGLYQVFSGDGSVTFGDGSVEKVYAEWWGADPTGSSDSTTAIETAIKTGKLLWCVPKATYKITTSISSTLVDVHIEGNDATFDGSTSTDLNLITLGGADGSSAALTTTFTAGATSLVTGLTGLVEHDIIHIKSTDAWGSVVGNKGEMAEVKSTTGTTINLKHRTYDGYTNTTTTITEINAKRVIVRNLRIVRDSNTAIGLFITRARDIEVSGCHIAGARYTGFINEYVYGGEVRNNYITDCWYTGTGNSYGIMTSASQMLNIVGNRIFDAKHGIAHGGTYVYRDILLDGNYVDNKRGISNHSFDFHANGEFVTVINNTIFNSLLSSCRNITVKNNRVYMTDSNFSAIDIWMYDDFDYIDVTGNKVYATGTTARGINIAFSEANQTINSVNVSDNYVESTYHGIAFSPRTNLETGITINQISVNNNTVFAIPPAAAGISAIYVAASGAARLKILSLLINGGYLSGSNYSIKIEVDTSEGDIKILNTYITSPVTATLLYGYTGGGAADFHSMTVRGNTFNCTGDGILIKGTGEIIISENTFLNLVTNRGIRAHSVIANRCILSNNIFENCLGTIYTSGGSSIGVSNITFGAIVPVTDTYRRGDVIHNTVAASGVTSGWVCITSGTFSAATDATGDTDGSTAVITGMADTSDFYLGQFVSVSAGFATTGPFEVLRKTATTITIDTNSNAVQANVTVSTPDPTFAAMANLP